MVAQFLVSRSLVTSKLLRVAIVGSRVGVPVGAVRAFVRSLPVGCLVVSGGAAGVDTVAAVAARSAGLSVQEFLPAARVRSAFLARNTRIVEHADVVVAFHNGSSTGTLHTIGVARRAGVPVVVVSGPSWCLAAALLAVGKAADEDFFYNIEPTVSWCPRCRNLNLFTPVKVNDAVGFDWQCGRCYAVGV